MIRYVPLIIIIFKFKVFAVSLDIESTIKVGIMATSKGIFTFITRNHYTSISTHNAWEYSQQMPKVYKISNESFSDFGIRLLIPLGSIDLK